jgi:hypothetical protein
MALSKAQQTLINRVRSAGTSALGVYLDDEICAYLVAVIARDLNLHETLTFPSDLPDFFSSSLLTSLRLEDVDFHSAFEYLIQLKEDADTYFYCLANLHKARLKYERILQAQALPTIDQVGPRSLLQYGALSPKALAGLLFWRKWLFDIDNRAGQETGYLFEPIIAYAIGGVPVSASKSPVRRKDNPQKGRQVDCILDRRAYEIKIRVTIAASGQGRWREELSFPEDCQASGYTPVLLVLDATSNPKLRELSNAFHNASGEVYTGEDAWSHLTVQAGATMSRFLELYVHTPIQALLEAAPDDLPEMTLQMHNRNIIITVDGEALHIQRDMPETLSTEPDEMPGDVDEE